MTSPALSVGGRVFGRRRGWRRRRCDGGGAWTRGGLHGLEAKSRRDLMGQDVVALRGDRERERAATRTAAAQLARAHFASGGRDATGRRARTSSEHDLHDDLVFSLAKADAELLRRDWSWPRPIDCIKGRVVDFGKDWLGFLVFGFLVVLCVGAVSGAAGLASACFGGTAGGGGAEVCASSPLIHIAEARWSVNLDHRRARASCHDLAGEVVSGAGALKACWRAVCATFVARPR